MGLLKKKYTSAFLYLSFVDFIKDVQRHFARCCFAVSLVIKKAQNKTFSLARKQNLHLDLNRLLTFVYLFPFFLSLYGQAKAPCPIVRYGYFIFLSLQISRLPADKERPVSRSAPVQNLGCSHVGCLHSTR